MHDQDCGDGGPSHIPAKQAKSFLLVQMLWILSVRQLSKPTRRRSSSWRTLK